MALNAARSGILPTAWAGIAPTPKAMMNSLGVLCRKIIDHGRA